MANKQATKEEPWFVGERAEWFASLVLTKHDNVKVKPYAGKNTAIDLLVEVLKNGKPTLRLFGVQLVPFMDLPRTKDAEERVLARLGTDPFEAALPLCVFVIGVRKPEGIYRWVVAPVVEDGQAHLHQNEEINWQPLNETGADRLIREVNAWYDALNGNSTPKTRERHAKVQE